LRTEAASGNIKPDVSTIARFQDDKYLQPFLEDDALLFSLDELENLEIREPNPSLSGTHIDAPNGDHVSRIKELEAQLARLNHHFTEYRNYVQQTIDKRWQENEVAGVDPETAKKERAAEGETGYFDSYSYNGIVNALLYLSIANCMY
jgi:type I protein arginine methyltransferase